MLTICKKEIKQPENVTFPSFLSLRQTMVRRVVIDFGVELVFYGFVRGFESGNRRRRHHHFCQRRRNLLSSSAGALPF